ncbi:hypothetical protein N657DRAFT_503880 [Parathielavia appendiculata]|uniref:Uncharacterized protein n=1 Tax=Parathielavia appendiculata TaxID=2587402 RepID=A0AAN6Z1S7_9PEZI|nr:hypothetical protein N657DRAFT_503880 [Parathielavia appendiculata]
MAPPKCCGTTKSPFGFGPRRNRLHREGATASPITPPRIVPLVARSDGGYMLRPRSSATNTARYLCCTTYANVTPACSAPPKTGGKFHVH